MSAWLRVHGFKMLKNHLLSTLMFFENGHFNDTFTTFGDLRRSDDWLLAMIVILPSIGASQGCIGYRLSDSAWRPSPVQLCFLCLANLLVNSKLSWDTWIIVY